MKFPCINIFYHENMNYLQIDLEYNSRLFSTVPCLEIIFGYIFAFTFFFIYLVIEKESKWEKKINIWGSYVKIDYSTQFYKWEAIIPFSRKNRIRHFVKRSHVQGVHNRV